MGYDTEAGYCHLTVFATPDSLYTVYIVLESTGKAEELFQAHSLELVHDNIAHETYEWVQERLVQ